MPNRNEQPESTPRKPPEQPRGDNEASKKALKGDEQADAKKKWDIIDENAWESFPASDAPASWAGKDLSPEEREELNKRKE